MKKWIANINFKKILIIFLLFRVLDFAAVIIAHYVIPYLGFFPMRGDILSFNLPYFITNFANFDGVHYLNISRFGYSMYEQAFFPLYPLLIALFSKVLNNQLIVGLLLSNLALLTGIYLLYLLLKNYLKPESIFWVIILLLSFPTSFFFGAVYTESLFLFLSIGYLFFVKKKNLALAFIFGVMASLTRNIGIFLVIPAFLILFQERKSLDFKKIAFALLAPIVGLASYSVYLYKTVGDPFFFYHSLPAFGVNKSDSIILLPQVIFRYLKIFSTFEFNFQYLVAILEMTVFLSVFLTIIFYFYKNYGLVIKNTFFLGLGIFSFIQILLPTLTGSLSSIPRYSLFSFSFFIILSQIKNVYLKIAIFVMFLFLHIMLLGFFAQGYFIS